MSKLETIAKGDLVLTPEGSKATVLYLHRRTPHALVLFQGRAVRTLFPLAQLTKLPDSDRTPRSRKARSTWAARKVMHG